jgi:ABC-2 type transport system ATP-binding protein
MFERPMVASTSQVSPPVASPDAVMDAHDLRMVYPPSKSGGTGTVAVDGISFQVRRGEIFGLLGPNGAGKTTTISILTTLIKPTAGRARIEGLDVLERPQDVRRKWRVPLQNCTRT